MARYVVLFNSTEQGIRNFGDSVNRAEAAGKMFESLGGSLVDIYWTMGQYDIVGVADFPDDETASAAMLRLGQLGNVKPTTLRAFDRQAMQNIIGKTDS